MRPISDFADLTVLGFHAIADLSRTRIAPYGIPKAEFAQVIDELLERGFTFIRPQELFESAAPPGEARGPHRLLVTIDDCYQDLLDAFDVLGERKINALVFPVSALIGRSNEWDRHLDIPDLPLLSEHDLNSLVAHGWLVGSHTHTHPVLTSLDDDAVTYEIQTSVATLNSMGLSCTAALAYPFGAYDLRVAALAQRASISRAFTTEVGCVTSQTDPLAIPRVEVFRGDLGEALIAKILHGRRPIRPA